MIAGNIAGETSVSVCVDSGDHFIPGSDRNECSHARISEI